MADIISGPIDVIYNVFDRYTGQSVEYKKVTTLFDGTPITDARCDGVIYRKLSDGSYAERVITGPINVKWWGATGNGTTDDSDAIQAALNAVRRQPLFFPRGIYRITKSITIPNASHIGGGFYGEGSIGQGGTIGVAAVQILIDGAINGFVFGNTTQTLFSGIEINNIQFKGTSTAIAGLVLNKISNFYIHRCTFSDFTNGTGLLIDGINAKVQYGTVVGCSFGKNKTSLHIHQGNGMRVWDNMFDGADNSPGNIGQNIIPNSIGIFFDEGDTNEMMGNIIQFYSKGVLVKGIQRFTSINTRIEGCPEHGFKFENSPEFRVIAGSMTNFIIGGNKGTGIEWDATSTKGVIWSVPTTSFVNEVVSGESPSTHVRLNDSNLLVNGDINARTRVYTSGYFQGGEIRSATANPTSDARLLLGVNGVQFVQNKATGATIVDIQNLNSTYSGMLCRWRSNSGVVLSYVDVNGKFGFGKPSGVSAQIHIGGNNSNAPNSGQLKFDNTTLVSAIEDGLVEFNSNNFHISKSGRRTVVESYREESKTYNPGTIAPNTFVNTTFNVGGALLGHFVNASFDKDTTNSIQIFSRVSSNGVITVTFRNIGTGDVTVPEGILKIRLYY